MKRDGCGISGPRNIPAEFDESDDNEDPWTDETADPWSKNSTLPSRMISRSSISQSSSMHKDKAMDAAKAIDGDVHDSTHGYTSDNSGLIEVMEHGERAFVNLLNRNVTGGQKAINARRRSESEEGMSEASEASDNIATSNSDINKKRVAFDDEPTLKSDITKKRVAVEDEPNDNVTKPKGLTDSAMIKGDLANKIAATFPLMVIVKFVE